jgi:hypothetical protein
MRDARRPLLQSTFPQFVAQHDLLALRDGGRELNEQLATGLGWVIATGALALYVPIICNLLKAGSAPESMSFTTLSLMLLGVCVQVVYHVRMGYELSTFGEMIGLGVQTLIMLSLVSFYRRRVSIVTALPVIGLCAALTVPHDALQHLHLSSAMLTTFALIPQILSNAAARSSGGWSPISAGLSTAGNGARCYTTLMLADGNPRLLFQFGFSLVLNAVLLWQTLAWP